MYYIKDLLSKLKLKIIPIPLWYTVYDFYNNNLFIEKKNLELHKNIQFMFFNLQKIGTCDPE